MILHYVECHGYVPPESFLEALSARRPLPWNGTAERLCQILLSAAADIGWRVDAAIDLANWQDERAYRALLEVAETPDLVDVSDMQIGVSIGILWSRAGKVDADAYRSVLPQVQWGIYKEMQRINPDLIRGLAEPLAGYDF